MAVLSDKIIKEAETLAQIYPKREAIIMPLCHAIQEEQGFISEAVKEELAKLVQVPLARVYEVVSFYTMFCEKAHGRHLITICVNMTCGLMGGESLCRYLSEKLDVQPGQTTKDGKFTLLRTNECLADCDHVPMMQINERYYGNLNREKVDKILAELE